MLDNQVARAVETHEMLKTERRTYLRWPAQEATGTDIPAVSQHDSSVTSRYQDDQTGSDGTDTPQRRSSGSSFEESDSDIEVTYICPCNKRFTRSVAYQRHLDVAHSNAEIHKCAVCSKTFGNERTLTMHMSVHQDSKQFTSTLERCTSKNKHAAKSHKIHTNIFRQVSEKNKAAACVGKLSIDSAHSNISINLIGATKVVADDKTPSSRDSSCTRENTTTPEDDSVGTDKENFSPPHATCETTLDSSDTLSSDSINVPPLLKGTYQTKSNLDLDITLPKSKPTKPDDNSAVVVSNAAKIISQSSFVSRSSERSTGTSQPNKVSVITIKTDRSLLSDSVLLQSKGSKPGEYTVSPARHSVIVIKTQEHKSKFVPVNKQLEPLNPQLSQESDDTFKESDELNSVRKSQRLQGKVPGWKHILVDKDDISSAEGRNKRRKMSKVKIEEEVANNMLIMSRQTATESYQHIADMVVKREIDVTERDFKRARLSNPESPCPGMVKSGIFKCPVCEKAFVSEKYLSMHMSLHKVDNSMQSLMSQNNKDDEAENNNINLALKAGNIASNGSFWTCKICNKVFAQNSNYKNHIRTHSDERPFVCQICSIGFKERYHLKKHMLFKHSDELKEECRFCGKKFKDSTAVRAHERIHSDVRPYSCRRCSKSFKTSECLWHHENRSKTCGQALLGMPAPSPRFKRGRQSKKDIKIENGIPSGVTVIPMSSNSQHLMPGTSLLLSGSHHIVHSQTPAMPYSEVAAATASIQSPRLPDLVPTSTPIPPTPLVKYHQTPITINTTTAATAQNVVTTNIAPISLPVSTAAYYTHSQNVVHSNPPIVNYTPVLVKVEPESALPDYELTAMASTDGSFEDSNCEVLMKDDPDMPTVTMMEADTGFADISHETMMQVQEEIEKDPVLEDIGMLLLEKSDEHDELSLEEEDDDDTDDEEDPDEILSDSNMALDKSLDDRYGCDKCGKRFVSAPAFDKHLLTHSGLRPYICNICGVGFKLKVHLKKHCLYRHSDEKPCECRICGKKFKDSSAVRLHERIHSDDRPFHCECGKTFKTRENLWGHRHRGPCEKKVKLSTDAPTTGVFVDMNSVSSVSDSLTLTNAPIYAHAQLGDTRLSAHAAISHNQIIARAIVSNNLMTAEASIGNNGAVMASASISGPNGTARAQLDTADNSATANVVPSINVGHQQSVSVGGGNARCETVTVPFPRATESRVTLPVLSAGTPMSGVPTAVVAPLKRENIVTAASVPVVSANSILKPIKILSPETAKNLDKTEMVTSPHREEFDKSEATLPPFETFSPKLRGKGPTLADRCPTIQRYLQMSRQPIKLPGIQQLFQTHSMAHNPNTQNGFMFNGDAQESLGPAVLPVRRTDPAAPLGPHPSQSKHANVVYDLTRSKASHPTQNLPVSSPHYVAAVSPHPPVTGHCVQIKSTARPPSTLAVPCSVDAATVGNGCVLSRRMIPVAQMIRATSPYLGGYGNAGLPLLLPSDPNLASTSGPGVPVQSPAEPPTTTATTPVYWDEDAEKKGHTSIVWHSEHEQLFQDLTQTTAFGQL